MKKEKTIRTYQRRTKSGKVVTVRQHTAKYDAAEALKEAAKKKGAGDELEALKKKPVDKPTEEEVAEFEKLLDSFPEELDERSRKMRLRQFMKAKGKKGRQAEIDETKWEIKEEKKARKVWKSNEKFGKRLEKSYDKEHKNSVKDSKDPYSAHGFTKEDFNEWYEGTGSANDKKVAKALRKTLGRKAYDELSDLAADNYKKGGASSFFKKNVHSKTAETKTSNRTKKSGSKDSDLVEHYDQFNKKSMGKAVGDSFTFSEGKGKDKVTYDARLVTDGKGRYGYVVRDKEEGPDAKYYVGISDGYERHSQLPAGLRKAAEAQGLRFKNGEFVKKETKGAASAKRMTLDEYLGSKGLSSPVSDFMIDKTKLPHGLTQRGKEKLRKEADKAANEYQEKRAAAIKEYKKLVKEGKIVAPTSSEQLNKIAEGHLDNASTQAAKRVLEKRAARMAKKLPKGSFRTVDENGNEIPGAPKHGTKFKADKVAKGWAGSSSWKTPSDVIPVNSTDDARIAEKLSQSIAKKYTAMSDRQRSKAKGLIALKNKIDEELRDFRWLNRSY